MEGKVGPCRSLHLDDWIGRVVGMLWWGGLGVGVWGWRVVGGAVKEEEGGNVTIYREDFGEEVGGGF